MPDLTREKCNEEAIMTNQVVYFSIIMVDYFWVIIYNCGKHNEKHAEDC